MSHLQTVNFAWHSFQYLYVTPAEINLCVLVSVKLSHLKITSFKWDNSTLI